ncbi:MAG: DUF1876 domain-containing protein [Micromonosporaceae bacterium]
MTTATTRQWQIDMIFEEDVDHTTATATVITPAGQHLRAAGQARRNPHDRPVARIGEEVAGARALSNLAHELLEYAAREIETNVRGERG